MTTIGSTFHIIPEVVLKNQICFCDILQFFFLVAGTTDVDLGFHYSINSFSGKCLLFEAQPGSRQAVLFMIRGCGVCRSMFLLLFISSEAIKPLSTSTITWKRSHLYFSVWVEEGFRLPKYFSFSIMV